MQAKPDKFYPPRVGTPRFLKRDRVIDELLRQCGQGRPTIFLQAQAGQGKTTVIKQFLDRLNVASAWYQVGPEDADPALFLLSIRDCMGHHAPGCAANGNRSDASNGAFALFDLPRHIDTLLNDLRYCLAGETYLVFDDVHNLINHESSLFILNHLLQNAPPKLHFILSSREKLPLDVSLPHSGRLSPVVIDNHDLALTENETADFFLQVFDLPLTHEEISSISSSTDGWVMGTLLLGLQMVHHQGLSPAQRRFDLEQVAQKDILDYFRSTVFGSLSPNLHEPLLKLSLLDKIPVELARTLTGLPTIGRELGRLAQRNMFIHHLDSSSTLYGLHHLFRQFLREKASLSLPPETLREIHQQAGHYYFQQNNPLQALRFMLKAQDFASMESILQEHGMAMLAANQTATLTTILGQVPAKDLERLGWTNFFLALAQLDFAPIQALPLLSRALDIFCGKHDEPGKLLCLAHIISIHITTTGHYREGEALLAQAEAIFSQEAQSLDLSSTILLARSLAMGHCIFLADTDTALRYANLGLTLARKKRLINFEAAMLMIMGYIQIFAGRMSLAKLWLEQAYAAVHRPEVGSFHCLAIRMMLFNFLFHDGQFDGYFDQKQQLIASIGNTLVSQSIAGPFCHVWEMDIAINQGRFEDACAIAEKAQASDPPPSPHLSSQILQLKAVALALTGQTELALHLAEQSAHLRDLAGGRYFVTLSQLLTGLTHGLCGQYQKAMERLGAGIENARLMPTEYLEACGLLHSAAIRLKHEDRKQAAADLTAGLGLMRRNGYRHFWAWTPQAIGTVLGFAVSQGIEVEYARLLAAQRLDADISDDGSTISRLSFQTLGGFVVCCEGQVVLHAHALTPTQRELLCLLLASQGLIIAQDIAQLHFWPDSSPSAAKAKFDTLVSRLRKTLDEALPKQSGHSYVKRDKGIIWLEHCKSDAHDFEAAVQCGLEHFRMQEYWQAGNAFTRAEALWQGDFAPGVSGEHQVRNFRDSLARSLGRMALVWCEHLAQRKRLQKALDVAEKAVRADPFNDALWALFYRLHGQRSAISARQILHRFADFLRAEDYPENEIADMVRSIASCPSPSA